MKTMLLCTCARHHILFECPIYAKHRHLLGNRNPAWFEYLTNNKFGITKLAYFLKRTRAFDRDYDGMDNEMDRIRPPCNPDEDGVRSS